MQFLAMIAAAGGGDSSSGGGGGGRWHQERRTPERNSQGTAGSTGAGAGVRNVHERRWPAALPLERGEAAAAAGVGEERPPVVSGRSRSLVAGRQGRSLSDLLREIEETMRAQREEVSYD